MDPHLIDLMWEVHREVEAKEPIWIICGYRSPATNAMLRRRSSGVAKFSQHMLGKAIDFYIPGVPLEKLRDAGLRAQRGGVGFYPSSNFVHLDTGSVRHWPRMPDAQIARVMAKGPLTRYAKGRRRQHQGRFGVGGQAPNPLAQLFGTGQDYDEDHSDRGGARRQDRRRAAPNHRDTAAVPMPPAEAAPSKVEPSRSPPDPKPSREPKSKPSRIQARRRLRPRFGVVAAGPAAPGAGGKPRRRPAGDLRQRRHQHARLLAGPAGAEVAAGSADASAAPTRRRRHHRRHRAEPDATASLAPWPIPRASRPRDALAYAPVTADVPPSRPAAMGTGTARAAVQPDTTVAVKRSGGRPTIVSSPAATAAAASRPASASTIRGCAP